MPATGGASLIFTVTQEGGSYEKYNFLVIFLLLTCILCSCSQPNHIKGTSRIEETSVYIVPNSYFEYTGTDVSEAVDSYIELGAEYCTHAEVVDEGMKLELTPTQRDNLVRKNNEFISELEASFESNPLYSYIPDENYKQVTFFFDENISTLTQFNAVLGVVAGYGLNYILINNTTEWNVYLVINNCHTGKEVMHANIPSETISYGKEEWEESYND